MLKEQLAIPNVTYIRYMHRSWRDCLSVRNAGGFTVMDSLIEKLPDAAQVRHHLPQHVKQSLT